MATTVASCIVGCWVSLANVIRLGRKSSGPSAIVRVVLDIHTLIVDEAFLSGDLHTAGYAATEAPLLPH
jgi:hypothetical protein